MVNKGLNIGAGSEFFDDQIIYKEDLQNIEYTKIKTIRDTIAACIYQPGVAIASLVENALQVVYVDNAHFTVNPGTAIDKFGRIIYVPDDTSVYESSSDEDYHPTWPDRENIAHGKIPTVTTRYYVNIYYATQQDIIETDDLGISQYTRIYDSYRIELENFEAGSGSFGDGGICLASFQVNSLGEIIYSIGDLRSILQMRTQAATESEFLGARIVYNQTSVADDTLNSEAIPNYFSSNSVGYEEVGRFAYKHQGQDFMNVQFCVPTYSDIGTLRIYLYPYLPSGSTYSYTAFGVHNYSFFIGTIEERTYITYIYLKKDGASSTYVRDIVIDVS
jgi:hypothetical protein